MDYRDHLFFKHEYGWAFVHDGTFYVNTDKPDLALLQNKLDSLLDVSPANS